MPDKVERWDGYDRDGNLLDIPLVRGETVPDGVYHLVAQIWVRNEKNEMLAQRRALSLKHLPGVWATPAGSVLRGETAREGARRELKEEMGIDLDIAEFQFLRKEVRWPSIFYSWVVKWEGELDELNLQEEEVADARWVSKKWIQYELQAGRFHDYGNALIDAVFAFEYAKKR